MAGLRGLGVRHVLGEEHPGGIQDAKADVILLEVSDTEFNSDDLRNDRCSRLGLILPSWRSIGVVVDDSTYTWILHFTPFLY